MEQSLIEQLEVVNGMVLVKVILSSILLIITVFVFAKVRLLRKFWIRAEKFTDDETAP